MKKGAWHLDEMGKLIIAIIILVIIVLIIFAFRDKLFEVISNMGGMFL